MDKKGSKDPGWTAMAFYPELGDLTFAVSSTALVLTRNLEFFEVKLGHLLQYLNTTKTMGLLYAYPKKPHLTEVTVFGDSSFAPSGKHSQSGFTVHFSYGNCRHLIHWQSLREPKIAESSADSELYALGSARKSDCNFRLLLGESITTSVVMSLRCDNTAAISMLDEPGWRTRYISIYGRDRPHFPLFLEGILEQYPEIGDCPKKALSNPPESSIEPLQKFYRTLVRGTSEPQTGFY